MKIDKSLILNEIKKHYSFKKEIDFANFLDVKPQTLASWHSRNVFDIELLYEKCNEISAEFLLTGKGEILRKKDFYYKDVEIETMTLSEPGATYGKKVTHEPINNDKDQLIATLQKFVHELQDDKKEMQDDKRLLKNIIENNFQKNVG